MTPPNRTAERLPQRQEKGPLLPAARSLGRKRPRRAAVPRRHRHIALQQDRPHRTRMQVVSGGSCYAHDAWREPDAASRRRFDAAASMRPSRTACRRGLPGGGRLRQAPVAGAAGGDDLALIDFYAIRERARDHVRAGDPAVLPLHASPRTTSRAAALFDPVTEADRAGEVGDASAHQAHLPDPRHRRRGVRRRSARTPNMSGCSTRSTAPASFIAGLPTWGTLIGLQPAAAARPSG